MNALAQLSSDHAIGNKLPVDVVKDQQRPAKPAPQLKPDQYLNSILDKLAKESEQDAWVRADIWNRNYYFFLGGLKNAYGGSVRGIWKSITDMTGLHTANSFAEKEMTLMSVLARSNARFKISPSAGSGATAKTQEFGTETGDDPADSKRDGALVGQRLTDHDLRMKNPASARLRRWFYRMNYGTSFRFTTFDKNAGKQKAQSPIMRPEQFDLNGMNICGKCGMTFPGQAAMPCKCGAPAEAVEHFPGQSMSEDVLSDDYESVGVGDTRWFDPNPWEVALPPNARCIVEGGQLQWDAVSWNQNTRNARIAYLYDIHDEISDGLEIPFMNKALERLERRYLGPDYARSKDFSIFRRTWLRPYMYWEGKFNQDTKLANGKEITEGTRYIDAMPEGAYIARVGHRILDIQPANIDDHWAQAHYTYNPHSAYGKGLEDGADLQVILNTFYQIFVEHGKKDSAGVTLVNQNAGVDINAFRGGNVIPTDIPLENDIAKVAKTLPGNSLSGTLPMGMDMVRNDMTAVTGASSVLAGTNEQLPETYGATQLLVQRATSILTPMMMMDVEETQRVVEQNLRLRQRFQSGDAFLPFTDENEYEQGRAFSGADVPADFVVSVVDSSWMPQDSLDIRADLEQAASFGQLPGGIWNPAVPPEAKTAALNALTNLPASLNKDTKDIENAHKRLNALKKGVSHIKTKNPPPDVLPMALQQVLTMPSIKAWDQIDNISVHIQVAQDYGKALMNGPADEVDYMLVQAVSLYVEMLKEGITEQKTEENAMQVAADTPMAMAQTAMGGIQAGQEAPPPAAEAPPVDPNAMVAHDHEAAIAAGESAESAADRAHEIQMAEHQKGEDAAKREHDLKMADKKVKAAKAKPAAKK